MQCDYCKKELTEQEILNTAIAEDMTVEELLTNPGRVIDVMCDKCAEGDGPYQ